MTGTLTLRRSNGSGHEYTVKDGGIIIGRVECDGRAAWFAMTPEGRDLSSHAHRTRALAVAELTAWAQTHEAACIAIAQTVRDFPSPTGERGVDRAAKLASARALAPAHLANVLTAQYGRLYVTLTADGAVVVETPPAAPATALIATARIIDAVGRIATVVADASNDVIAAHRFMSGEDIYVLGRGWSSEEGKNVGTYGSAAHPVQCDGLDEDVMWSALMNVARTTAGAA